MHPSTSQTYEWQWLGMSYQIEYEIWGQGKPVLLLPAFSTVSTRSEWHGLANLLAPRYRVILPDWIGFGDAPRPMLNYQPALYQAFLRDFVRSQCSQPVLAIAAGHAAGYVLHLAQQQPCPWSQVILVAPTWRGPLPTMMGDLRFIHRTLKWLIYAPGVGQALYALNTHPKFLRWMYQRHVYTDANTLTPDVLAQKWRLTQQPNARFAAASFVTGCSDPMETHDDFLKSAKNLSIPIVIVIGEQTPPKSRAEMESLAALPNVATCRMPGTLGLHEEHPDTLYAGLLPFLP